MEATIDPQTNAPRPKEVTRGALFLSASLGLGVVRGIVNLTQRTSGTTLIVASIVVIAFFAVLFFGVTQVLAGRNWARITILVIVAILILSIPVTLILFPSALPAYLQDLKTNKFLGTLGIVISVLQILGTYQLFTRNSNQWFRTRR
ncbi:MAG TPA: hypothetical protein VLL54_01670 [Pyrinomonadaceae bacterium]|nr:hypothetical protein [Pyrinomonadaceae bacterium]